MGGTSTDVSRFDGRYELEFETEKAGVRVVAPMMAIETVAAGGGSICRFDGVKLVVGPDSAGADPGPACYGRGGPLTVTDVNFYLGKILPERFPFPLDRAAVEARLRRLDRRDRRERRPHATSRWSWPKASCASPTPTWPRRSARSRSPRAATRATTCWCRSAARPGSMPAPWPASWACGRFCSIPTPDLLSAYGIGLADVERHARGRRLSSRCRRRRSTELEADLRRAGTRSRRRTCWPKGSPPSASRSRGRSSCAIGASKRR